MGWGWGVGRGEALTLPVTLGRTFPQFSGILQKISQRILIAFSDGAPSLLHRPLELRSNNRPSDFLQAVKKLLDSQAIEEVTDTSSPGYCSRLFLVPKPDGSFRPIIDLKKLNLFLDISSFKMKTLFSIVAALQPQEWITKIDLKDDYHHILVHVNIHKYFRFVITGKTYQFCVHPFGLNGAPRVHQNISTSGSAVPYAGNQNSCLPRRLDHPSRFTRTEFPTYSTDHPTLAVSRMDYQLEEVYARSLTHARLLGLTFQSRESHNISSRLILRFCHQCPILSISIYGHACTQDLFHHKSHLTLRPLYPPWAPATQVPAVLDKRHWAQHRQSWDTPIQLDADFLSHLCWFNRQDVFQGVPLHLPEPSLFFFTDASLTGWGAGWQDRHLSGQWFSPDSAQHINWLELEAIRLAALQWGPQRLNQTVHV